MVGSLLLQADEVQKLFGYTDQEKQTSVWLLEQAVSMYDHIPDPVGIFPSHRNLLEEAQQLQNKRIHFGPYFFLQSSSLPVTTPLFSLPSSPSASLFGGNVDSSHPRSSYQSRSVIMIVKSITLSGMLAALALIQVKVIAYPESLATNCIPHAWAAIGGAADDAAAMMILASATIAASMNSSSKFDPHSMILAARWFGAEAWPMDNDPLMDPHYIQTMHQIQGTFDRASVLLFTETINFFCYDSCEFRVGDEKTTNDLPPAYVRPGFGAPIDGITRVIRPEPNISDTTIGICPEFWNEKTYLGLLDAEVNLTPASTIIHAMMLLPGAGQSQNIIDLETHTAGKFDSDRKNTSLCLGPAKSQWLAWQNTTFALHNADNYANFALDATLQSFYVDELANQEFPKERLDDDEEHHLRLKLADTDHALASYLAAHARWESESTVMVVAPTATVQPRSATVTPFPIITRATAHNTT